MRVNGLFYSPYFVSRSLHSTLSIKYLCEYLHIYSLSLYIHAFQMSLYIMLSYVQLLSVYAEMMLTMEVTERTAVGVEVGEVIMRFVDDQANTDRGLQESVNTVYSVAEECG